MVSSCQIPEKLAGQTDSTRYCVSEPDRQYKILCIWTRLLRMFPHVKEAINHAVNRVFIPGKWGKTKDKQFFKSTTDHKFTKATCSSKYVLQTAHRLQSTNIILYQAAHCTQPDEHAKFPTHSSMKKQAVSSSRHCYKRSDSAWEAFRFGPFLRWLRRMASARRYGSLFMSEKG